jgi:dihydrofolate reductase
MRKSIIVAASHNGVIGSDGQLPWRLPSDLKRFKELTMGHTLIMGRKTFESLPPKLRPLPGRRTIGLTRQLSRFEGQNPLWAASLTSALILAMSAENEARGKDGQIAEVFICGGGEVYREALPLVDRVYLTVIERDFEGDTYFAASRVEPWWTGAEWSLARSERGEGELPHRFEIWDRVR